LFKKSETKSKSIIQALFINDVNSCKTFCYTSRQASPKSEF